MPQANIIGFDGDRSAYAAVVGADQCLETRLKDDLGLQPPMPVLVLVGGAAGLDESAAQRLEPLFRDTLAPLLDRLGAIVIDGGTDAGVMALMGRARAEANAAFLLLGVAASGTVCLPDQAPAPNGGHTALEPNHTHFLLVPGDAWGDEAPWIRSVAETLARGTTSATLVAGGGRITRMDLKLSLKAGRPTILLAGSGGTADLAAEALGADDFAAIGIEPEQAAPLRVVDLDSAQRDLPGVLASLLDSAP